MSGEKGIVATISGLAIPEARTALQDIAEIAIESLSKESPAIILDNRVLAYQSRETSLW